MCIITPMTELEDMLTTAAAEEVAIELGKEVSQGTIANAARRGSIGGARKLWNNTRAPWIFPRESFMVWLNSERQRGRPPKPLFLCIIVNVLTINRTGNAPAVSTTLGAFHTQPVEVMSNV